MPWEIDIARLAKLADAPDLGLLFWLFYRVSESSILRGQYPVNYVFNASPYVFVELSGNAPGFAQNAAQTKDARERVGGYRAKMIGRDSQLIMHLHLMEMPMAFLPTVQRSIKSLYTQVSY